MPIALTADGYKVSNATGTASATIGAGSTGTVTVTLSSAELLTIAHVLGVKEISVRGATAYLVAFRASGNTVTVTLYNPGTAAVTVTVTVTATVVGS